MNEVIHTSALKVQAAADKVQAAAKHVAEAAKENKKTIAIIAGCVTGVALIGATAYIVTKMVKPNFIVMGEEDWDYEDDYPDSEVKS